MQKFLETPDRKLELRMPEKDLRVRVGIRVAILFLVEQYKIPLLSNKAELSLDCYFAIVYIWLSRFWLANPLLLL